MADLPVRIHAKVTLDDGTVHEAGIDNRDYVRYDMTRAKAGWPTAQDAPFVFQAFTAAAALIRQGDAVGNPTELMERIVLVDSEVEETIRPTPPAPGSDS
jgi:hypothetical protein